MKLRLIFLDLKINAVMLNSLLIFICLIGEFANASNGSMVASSNECGITNEEVTNPNVIGAELRLTGLEFSEQGNYQCALKALEKSIYLLGNENPNAIASYEAIAEVYERQGKLSDAEQTLINLVERFSGENYLEKEKRAWMLMRLGEYYKRQDQINKAENSYLVALGTFNDNDKRNPVKEQLYRLLIQIYEHKGKYSQAAKMSENLVLSKELWVKNHPQDVDLLISALEEQIRLLKLADHVVEIDILNNRIKSLKKK